MTHFEDTTMIDMRTPEIVQITLGENGQVWVNVDGICRFRCYKASKIEIEDCRPIPDIKGE